MDKGEKVLKFTIPKEDNWQKEGKKCSDLGEKVEGKTKVQQDSFLLFCPIVCFCHEIKILSFLQCVIAKFINFIHQTIFTSSVFFFLFL
jgi:hypothetical protein